MSARSEIEARIPHREPFLFVDRIVQETERSIDAEWDVPADGSWFAGHYPGNPVLPGVLISEHVFQVAALFVSQRLEGFDEAAGVPVLTKIEKARFRRIVRTAETLCTNVKVDERVGPAWFMSGRVLCDEAVVLRISFVLSAAGAMQRVLRT